MGVLSRYGQDGGTGFSTYVIPFGVHNKIFFNVTIFLHRIGYVLGTRVVLGRFNRSGIYNTIGGTYGTRGVVNYGTL